MKFKENIPLSHFSSFKIGGLARYFFEPENPEEVVQAIGEWKNMVGAEFRKRLFILGGGTNLLISDNGFDGFVLQPKILLLERDGNRVSAGAGVLMADLLKFTVRENLSGLEWAGGLPGTFGGAVRGNAGAFCGEIKDIIESVRTINITTLKEKVWENKDCKFAFRSSVFKERMGEEIIIGATFILHKGDPKEIQAALQEKIDYRNARHPMEYPNIGSIFKNVPAEQFYSLGAASDGSRELKRAQNYAEAVKAFTINWRGRVIPVKNDPFPIIPTAYLISEVGLKGVSIGGAMISPKHANFIVNALDAKAEDVCALIELEKQEVKKEFGVDLEQEVQSV